MGLSREEVARIAATQDWHYEHDLGDGIVTRTVLPDHQAWHDLRKRILSDVIAAKYGGSLSGLNCLDIACNSGFWSFFLADLGARSVTGFDVAKRIEQARFVQQCRGRDGSYANVGFTVDDVATFDYGADRYDLIFCLGIFYHLTDVVGFARNLHRSAKQRVIVDTSVSDLEGAVLELSDHTKYRCCDSEEFALVPTREACRRIFAHVGFRGILDWYPSDEPGRDSYNPRSPRAIYVLEK